MFLQSDIDKLNQLHQDINNHTENSTYDLIFLWETLPKKIWHYYNHTPNGFDNKTWASVLIVLKHWEKSKNLTDKTAS